FFFFFQAEDGIRDFHVTGVQTCALPISSILPEIRAETLVVACREDRMVPVAQAKLLFASISNSRYIEISSGHALYVEAPAEVVQLVNQFSQHPEQYPVNQKIQPYMP